jgi:hypothetical protein
MSKCCILYHSSYPTLTSTEIMGLAAAAAPSQQTSSPGRITIQEYGIRFSLDMTTLLYSRGNVTEKIRCARDCVQDEEVVLDLYAGIGYYTLPALIVGKARHVHACEWNVDAVNALLFNVVDNGLTLLQPSSDEELLKGKEPQQKKPNGRVGATVTVYHGDSRKLLSKYKHLINAVDRVSMGLLPSSEGGWKTAIEALRLERGGWQHVHGNVPTFERKQLSLWLCSRLVQYCRDIPDKHRWTAICHQVIQVKSFAPRIDHVVADVFVGPILTGDEKWCKQWFDNEMAHENTIDLLVTKLKCGAARCSKDDPFDYVVSICNEGNGVKSPSCALSPDGVLHQAWMMPVN